MRTLIGCATLLLGLPGAQGCAALRDRDDQADLAGSVSGGPDMAPVGDLATLTPADLATLDVAPPDLPLAADLAASPDMKQGVLLLRGAFVTGAVTKTSSGVTLRGHIQWHAGVTGSSQANGLILEGWLTRLCVIGRQSIGA